MYAFLCSLDRLKHRKGCFMEELLVSLYTPDSSSMAYALMWYYCTTLGAGQLTMQQEFRLLFCQHQLQDKGLYPV